MYIWEGGEELFMFREKFEPHGKLMNELDNFDEEESLYNSHVSAYNIFV